MEDILFVHCSIPDIMVFVLGYPFTLFNKLTPSFATDGGTFIQYFFYFHIVAILCLHICLSVFFSSVCPSVTCATCFCFCVLKYDSKKFRITGRFSITYICGSLTKLNLTLTQPRIGNIWFKSTRSVAQLPYNKLEVTHRLTPSLSQRNF